MRKILAILFVGLFVQGCQAPAHELKSPCVGAEGSPCGPRINVNEHWMKSEEA